MIASGELISSGEAVIKYANGLTDSLIKSATSVASSAFRREMSEVDVRNHLTGDSLYLLINDFELNGFALFNHLEGVLYLNGIAVREEYQGKGFFYEVVAKELKSYDCDFFALRTQSAVMYNAAVNLSRKGLLSSVYPSEKQPSSEVLNALIRVKKHLGMSGDSFINEGFYNECLYGEEYSYNNRLISDYLNLDSGRGDSVIIIGVVK